MINTLLDNGVAHTTRGETVDVLFLTCGLNTQDRGEIVYISKINLSWNFVELSSLTITEYLKSLSYTFVEQCGNERLNELGTFL